jgi:ribosomal protein L11 methyltransferase
LENIQILQSEEFKIEYTFEEIDQWNEEEGEKNFEAIDVEGNCHVRAPFTQNRC